MFDMTFVLYCDDCHLWPKVCNMAGTYAALFSHTVLVLNLKQPQKFACSFPENVRHKITVLSFEGGLLMGSALNKMLVQLKTDRFFLLDPHYDISPELIELISSIDRGFYYDNTLNISLLHQKSLKSWAHSWPKNTLLHHVYGVACQYVPLIPWGALLLSVQSLAKIGGFEQQLSYDAMMIDLSWRLQEKNNILAESVNYYVNGFNHKKNTNITITEQIFLYKKYFKIYPKWLSWLHVLWSSQLNQLSDKELF